MHKYTFQSNTRPAYLYNPLKSRVISYGYTSNVQRHTGLSYHFNFRHSGTLALSRARRQSARMSEIKMVG